MLAVALLLAAAMVTACGSSEPESTPQLNMLARAAQVTSGGPGYKYSMHFAVTIGSHTSQGFGGEGAFGPHNRDGYLTLEVGSKKIGAVIHDGYEYLEDPTGKHPACGSASAWPGSVKRTAAPASSRAAPRALRRRCRS
jgi:hypothetical protein